MPTLSGKWSQAEAARSRGNWLDANFRASNPSDGNIIYALYGNGQAGDTAYTKHWTGSCIPTNVVRYNNMTFPWGTLPGNTVYVLESWNYSISSQITMNNCSAIIGNGNVTIERIWAITSMIYIPTKTNIILDNIELSGNNLGQYWILMSSSINNTINNIKTHHNTVNGIHINTNSANNTFNNIQSYNNLQMGINMNTASNNIIENTQTHNNTQFGIYIQWGSKNTINNTQTFNNAIWWFFVNELSVWANTINNSLSYNNQVWCISILGSWIDINNSAFFNNQFWMFLVWWKMKINSAKIFNNATWIDLWAGTGTYYWTIQFFNNTTNTWNGGFVAGSAVPSLSRTAGTITGGVVSYYEMVNPKNSNGDRLLNGTSFPTLVGTQVRNGTYQPIKYIFWKNIQKQKQPVVYNSLGSLVLATNLTYNTTKKIAEPENPLSDADQALAEMYFWDNTEYTRNWADNTCTLWAFNVVNISASPLPPTLEDHTIYILSEGEYESVDTVMNGNCIALIGSGNVRLYPQVGMTTNLLHATGKQNLIINNIKFDGFETVVNGVDFDLYTKNSTINNSKVVSNTQDGIRLGIWAENITVMNTQTYNNGTNGMEIYYIGKRNFINNSLSFDNGESGIRFGNGSIKNTINNSQFYNNKRWVFADLTTQENLLNNVTAYNNAEDGVLIKQSSGNMLNNIRTYNNTIGININDTNSTNNKYYGNLYVFENTAGNFTGTNGTDTYLDAGIPLNRLPSSWTLGTLQSWTMTSSCNTITNIRLNTDWLLDFNASASNCRLTGAQARPRGATRSYNSARDFLFGVDVPKQIQPVGYSGVDVYGSDIVVNLNLQYNSAKYIGEVNPIKRTKPSSIDIQNPCLNAGNTCTISTTYITNINFEKSMINDNIDINFTKQPSNLNAYLQASIDDGITRTDIGDSGTNFPYQTTKFKLFFQTPSTYNTGMTFSITIGTTGYGYTTKTGTIYTQQDPTPPTINFIDDVAVGGLRTGKDYVAVTWYGVHTILPIRFMYVTGSMLCTTGAFSGGSLGTQYITGLTLTGHNTEYLCFWTKDTANNQEVVKLSNQIKVSDLTFLDDVSATSGFQETIQVNFQNLYKYGYAFIDSGITCGGTVLTGGYLSGTSVIFTGTSAALVINSTTAYNGKYVCAYGEDQLGSGKFIKSAYAINVQDYSSQAHFTNNVELGPVKSETIWVYFASWLLAKKYGFTGTASACSIMNSGTMNTYPTSGDLIITGESYNGNFVCIYTLNTSGYAYMITSANPLNVDITAPTTPSILSPLTGDDITYLLLKINGSTDNNTAGLSGYQYIFSDVQNFSSIVFTGFSSGTGTTITPYGFNDENPDVYYWRVRAIDKAGNISSWSNTGYFNYLNNNVKFDETTNAQKETIYKSNIVTISGLRYAETMEVSINKWVLFKNTINKGTWTTIQNGDKLYIELMSSAEDGTTETSTMTIANRTMPYKVTTIGNTYDLDETQMLRIISIFNSLIETYQDDQAKLFDFLYTFKSMLEDEIALSTDAEDRAGKEYLLELVKNYLENEMNDNGLHTAPNCKEYEIVYDNDLESYYSSTMRTKAYYATREALIRYIDSMNPGDCHTPIYAPRDGQFENNNPDKHIAPNGKVYQIKKEDLGYTSPQLSKQKYFLSSAELRTYINVNNPMRDVWDHEVDPEFDPVEHEAPNGKVYKIYKTNRWYMSYKLLNIKYYGSLESLTSYIDKKNK